MLLLGLYDRDQRAIWPKGSEFPLIGRSAIGRGASLGSGRKERSPHAETSSPARPKARFRIGILRHRFVRLCSCPVGFADRPDRSFPIIIIHSFIVIEQNIKDLSCEPRKSAHCEVSESTVWPEITKTLPVAWHCLPSWKRGRAKWMHLSI